MKYIGICLIILGAIVLLGSFINSAYLGGGSVDQNYVQFGGLGLILVGFVAHILILKHSK